MQSLGHEFFARSGSSCHQHGSKMRSDPSNLSVRSEEHTSELQSLRHLVCRLLLENDAATTEIYTLSLHDALPICHEFFARSGSSCHQHGSKMRSDPSNLSVHLQHKRATPNHAFELICINEFLIQAQSLLPQRSFL